MDAPTLEDRGPVFSALVAPTPRLPEVLETWTDLEPKRWSARQGAIVEGSLKLVRSDQGAEALYDVVADPLETKPLDRPEDAARLGRALASWRRSLPRYEPARRTARDRPGRPLEQDDATRAQLEALGYAAGEE